MGEFKITDIVDQRLQRAAANLDKTENGGNGNGKIDGDEVSVFGGLKLDEKGYNGEEYSVDAKKEHAKIMQELGVELSTAATSETQTGVQTTDKPATSPYSGIIEQLSLLELPVSLPIDNNLASSEKAPKEAKNWVKDEVKTAAKKANSINELKRIVLERKGKAPSRETSWNDAFIALMAISQVKTKKDVENLEKTMEATLKAQGRWNDVTKEVAKRAKEVAKKQLINEEYNELLRQFDAKKAAETGANYNFKQYLKDIKKGLGETKDTYKKEAYEKLEKTAKKQAEALNTGAAHAAYWGEEAVKTDSSYKKTKENKHLDKIYGYKTTHNARTEALKKLTRKEIEDNLDKDVVKKLEDYMAEHFDETTRTYDLSGLVTDFDYGMDKYAGADATVNHHSDELLDERTHIASGLEALTGQSFSKGDIKNLRKFVALQEQKKSRNFGEAAKDSLPYVAYATAAGIACGVTADQRVEITFNDKSLFNQIAQQLGNKAVKDELSMKIIVHQFADLRWIQGPLVGLTAGIMKMATQLIFGKEKDEKTCFSVGAVANFDSIESLEKFVKAESPLKAEALLTMAQLFVDKSAGTIEKGTDDYKAAEKAGLLALYQALNRIGGSGSPLNKDECAVAAGELMKALEAVKPYKPCAEPPCDEFTYEETPFTTPKEDNVAIFDNRPDRKAGKQEYKWADIARIYSCLDGYSERFKARFMKILQAITDGNYDIIRIKELTKQSLNDGKAQNSLKNIPGFDYDIFMDFYNNGARVGDSEYKVIAPEKLTTEGGDDCVRDDSRIGKASKIVVKKGRKGPNVTTNGKVTTSTQSTRWDVYDCDNKPVRSFNDEASFNTWKQGKKVTKRK